MINSKYSLSLSPIMKTLYASVSRYCFPCIFLIFSFSVLHGQEKEAKKQSVFDKIYNPEPQQIELIFDLKYLMKNKFKDQYQDVVFTHVKSKKESESWPAELKPRGKFRLRKCDFPPIKIKFKKDELKSKGLKKHNEYKLVTHCLSVGGAENVYRELLIYKMYEIFTEQSFRTQLVKVVYKDSESKRKIKGVGVLIEDEAQLAKRMDGDICDECFGLPDSVFHWESYQLNALFQFMIGNTDFSVPMARNLKLVESEETGKTFVVPYDFDFSGLVNAPYCVPNVDYGMTSCRQRKFLGKARSLEELAPVIQSFKEKKTEIISFVNGFEYLSSYSRKDILAYIRSFYESLENESFLTELVDYRN